MKQSGLITNFFYAYKEDDKWFLLDGFNRLFTDYGVLEIDTPIYVKVVTDKLEDHQLMSLMFNLNMWKLNSSDYSYGGFKIYDFIDRGFSLFLKAKFDITFYNNKYNYHDRTRDNNDIFIIDEYFIHESESSSDFKYSYEYVAALFKNENIIADFKELLKSNDYLKQPFKNYRLFLEGYARFLSISRLKGYKDNNMSFEFCLNKLYEDKKFFTKLQGMSGNDSTRKNIYAFYRKLNLN
jgi:hypothetical protein